MERQRVHILGADWPELLRDGQTPNCEQHCRKHRSLAQALKMEKAGELVFVRGLSYAVEQNHNRYIVATEENQFDEKTGLVRTQLVR